jgi:uncharacterized protein
VTPDRSGLNIVVFGAAGRLGHRIVAEASSRGHAVTSVVRESEARSVSASVVAGDSTSEGSVRALAGGADVLVSAVGGPDKTIYLRTAQTLVETLRPMRSAPRIIHSGGGGSLLDADGVRFVDAPGFPPELREEVLGQAAALDFYRASTGVTWTYMSPPPGNFAPGERVGRYRVGTEHPVTDEHGNFGISFEDYAVALVDEIETPAHLNSRFTVGY